jgi:hypothetical protein
MLSASIVVLTFFNMLLLFIYTTSEPHAEALGTIYEVENLTHTYQGRSTIQVFLSGSDFEFTSVVEETKKGGKKLYYEMSGKGKVESGEDNVYYINFSEHNSNFIQNGGLPTLPIVKDVYNAERKIPSKNMVELKSKDEDYVVLVTYMNGGHIIAMKRY